MKKKITRRKYKYKKNKLTKKKNKYKCKDKYKKKKKGGADSKKNEVFNVIKPKNINEGHDALNEYTIQINNEDEPIQCKLKLRNVFINKGMLKLTNEHFILKKKYIIKDNDVHTFQIKDEILDEILDEIKIKKDIRGKHIPLINKIGITYESMTVEQLVEALDSKLKILKDEHERKRKDLNQEIKERKEIVDENVEIEIQRYIKKTFKMEGPPSRNESKKASNVREASNVRKARVIYR